LKAASGFFPAATIRSTNDIETVGKEFRSRFKPSYATQCAIDLALWDLLAKEKKISVTELIFGVKPHPVKSCCTIGLSTPEELVGKIAELRDNPVIKVKMDATANLEALRYIRSQTKADLVVDANCAWADVNLEKMSRDLADLGVLFIEQPLPPEQLERMPARLSQSVLPIIADESCVLPDDVAKMPGNFSGFNIKLVKCGGLTPALQMLRAGQARGLKTMVGCMLETSILISAGAVIGQQTDFADLDGSWLLRDDPFQGLQFEKGILTLPSASGLGVHR
jgi:L-alanine-DL-glutamate epimerase-like enolase superfamily enzyme